MKLKELLRDLSWELLTVDGHRRLCGREEELALCREVGGITSDSRRVVRGSLFIAVRGANTDGHVYAEQVVRAGAAVLVVEHAVELPLPVPEVCGAGGAKDPAGGNAGDKNDAGTAGARKAQAEGPVQVVVPSTRYAMAMISAAFYGYPARRMRMIGITGTKGKTTTTYLVKSILERAGMDTGLIGTIEVAYHENHYPAANTTPESIVLQRYLREMADAGVQAVVMEVSSQALMMDRTAGIQFDIGVFTNLSEDHIGPNEHRDFEDYLHCKSLLFRQCALGIVNGDDPYADRILEGSICAVERFGMRRQDDLYAERAQLVQRPGELGIRFDVGGRMELPDCEVPTPGSFSIYNALAAIAICRRFGVRPETIRAALRGASTKGRIELVKVSGDFTLMIDYAHNAMALESLLTTLKEYHPHRLVTVFGCGGNRARSRRFEMGEVSGRLSDLTVITSDNPRFEEPLDIINDIVTGISGTDGAYVTIPDRKKAIAWAIHHGEPGDIIVLAGKGHEDYQEIRGKKYPMDERILIREILEEDARDVTGDASGAADEHCGAG